ncbi:MAG: DUF4279 domain-containing protein, partial [Rhodovibrionaceae bacterium]|nr:DUF4279 domain-containing protein [Rhodovibrionaceae bacterium]
MAEIDRTTVTLRIFGPGLEPERVTRLLGHSPSAAEREGEAVADPGAGAHGKTPHDSWQLSVEPRSPGDLDGRIRDLLAGLSADLDVWAELAAAWRIDLFCGLFLADANEGLPLSLETLRMLAERGIALELDIYGPPPGRASTRTSQAQLMSDAEPRRPKSMLVVGSLAE